MTDFETVQVDLPRPGVGVLTLHRPARLNAMNTRMFAELRAVCEAWTDDPSVRVVVVTGAGRGFCSGYDLDEATELAELTPEEMLARQELGMRAILALRELRQPLVAAVNGPAAGGGLSLALTADFRLAAPEAHFAAAFVRLGMSSGDLGYSWHLPRVVGVGHAAELMLTGRRVEADEAARIGLVNRVVPAADLLPHALETAELIAGHTPLAVSMTKRALYANLDAPLRTALEVENRGQTLATRDPGMPKALEELRGRLAHRTRES